MNWLDGGVTSPKGFSSAGMHCGVKKKKDDLSMIYSKQACQYAGVFTKNVVQAAPVKWNKERLMKKDLIRGIVINSGNANACTGQQGYEDARSMATTYAEQIDTDAESILVASTGVIGVPMPMEIINKGILDLVPMLGEDEEHAHKAAQAIMTTDTFPKEVAVCFEIEGKPVTIAGMCKGSGMIQPNMGTMLSFITTDAVIEQEVLEAILRETITDTYNMISVDGDTSTNDMVLVMANGMSDASPIVEGSSSYKIFKDAFYALNEKLAKLIAQDGEGATKLIEVKVKNMSDKQEARKMAHAVITSNLVKAAFFGEDANWGRVLCALGYSGADFDPELVDVYYQSKQGEILLLKGGQPILFDENYAAKILKEKEIKVLVDCNQGDQEATGWGCDLSYDYVKINGEYRT